MVGQCHCGSWSTCAAGSDSRVQPQLTLEGAPVHCSSNALSASAWLSHAVLSITRNVSRLNATHSIWPCTRVVVVGVVVCVVVPEVVVVVVAVDDAVEVAVVTGVDDCVVVAVVTLHPSNRPARCDAIAALSSLARIGQSATARV